jgi:uncharacterized protein YdcH (DUF465 family)
MAVERMQCPICAGDTTVVREADSLTTMERVRKCEHGHDFVTKEEVVRILHDGMKDEKIKVKDEIKGGLSKGGSDLGSSGSGSFSLTSPSKISGARARRGRGRPSTTAYTPGFEAFWQPLTPRHGTKQKAFDAWMKIGLEFSSSITPDILIQRFTLWSQTRQWREGFAPHVSTWLNAGGWEHDPDPSEFGVAAVKVASPYCGFHRAKGNNGRLPPYGAEAGCPECKHAMAKKTERRSDPEPWRGRPPTANELAALRAERFGVVPGGQNGEASLKTHPESNGTLEVPTKETDHDDRQISGVPVPGHG